MTGYISTSQPTWLTRIFGFLSSNDQPIEVNCWYCNQDSHLLPRSNQTERYWYCNLCENYNVRDDNGDIVDFIPPAPEKPHRRPVSPRWPTGEKLQRRSLCERCQNQQTLIYVLVSNYIKDENDPDYDYYVRTADEYKSRLQEKYPLCESCEQKVDELVDEQKAAFSQLSQMPRIPINEEPSHLETVPPTTFEKWKHSVRGAIWVLLHGVTILLYLYASQFPLFNSTALEPSSEALSIWQSLLLGLRKSTMLDAAWLATLVNSLRSISDLFVSVFQRSPHVLQLITTCVSGYTDDNIRNACQWTPLDFTTLLFIMNALSYYWLDWHPMALYIFQENTRVTGWKFYTSVQRVIFILRFALIWIVTTADQRQISTIMKLSSLLITVLLLLSVFSVSVTRKHLVLRQIPIKKEPVQNTANTSNTSLNDLYSSKSNRKSRPSKEAIEALRMQVPKEMHRDDVAEANAAAVIASVKERRARFEEMLRKLRSSQPGDFPNGDNDVEKIMDDINKLELL